MICQNRTKHTDWNDRTDECPKHFIFIAQNIYIQWFALLFYGNVASSCGKFQVLSVSYFLDWKIYCTLLFCVLHALNTKGKECLNCIFLRKEKLEVYTAYLVYHTTLLVGHTHPSWGIIFPEVLGGGYFVKPCYWFLIFMVFLLSNSWFEDKFTKNHMHFSLVHKGLNVFVW